MHGKRLTNMILKEDRLGDFIRLWRQYFQDTMKPRAMPFVWEQTADIYAKFGLQIPTEAEIAEAFLKPLQKKRSTDMPLT